VTGPTRRSSVDGKVANILTEYEIAANIGAEHGVRVGDTARIFKVVSVTDPDTGEVLGNARVFGARFAIHNVQAKFSLMRMADFITPRLNTAPQLKRIVQYLDDEDQASVFVSAGDELTVTPQPERPPGDDDDIPF